MKPSSAGLRRLIGMDTLDRLRAGALAGTTRLNLKCGLREFPREIFALADTLEILDLSGNQLSSLPDDLPRLHKLRILFCSDNRFTELPAVLGQCAQLSMVGFKSNRIRQVPAAALPPELRWLILTDNEIATLPSELGRCTQLQKLMLAGNRLRELPASLAACTRLELLRIAANDLPDLPAWLLTLPRLSWLAYAGNPFCVEQEQHARTHDPIPAIPWSQLQLHDKLGEGASGVIHRASWQPGGEVAVKLFKGAVTSDGSPHSEMAACIHAGGHAGLIPLRGRVVGHPDQVDGLVLALVDARFRNLAGPPSLASCTRDIYPEGTHFTLQRVLRIASRIAATAEHLHARGLMHGDLYAHNMLHDGAGEVLLGDFGAASFHVAGDAAAALQRIEVRAFACLLEELLQRCTADAAELQALWALQRRCAGEEVLQRPTFADIGRQLQAMR